MFDWIKFIEKQKLTSASNASGSLDSGTQISLLNEYAFIRIAGPDAITFLQGQLTCDMTQLENNQYCLGAHCNPKGRVISSGILSSRSFQTLPPENETPQSELEILYRVHASNAETAYAALKKYSVFSKVNLSIADDICAIGIIEPMAMAMALEPQIKSPTEYSSTTVANTLFQALKLNTSKTTPLTRSRDNTIAANDSSILISYAINPDLPIKATEHTQPTHSISELWLTEEALKDIWPNINDLKATIGHDRWTKASIDRGIAEVQHALSEKYLPQELNLQLIHGVSLKKGCYTGQEVIARLHYRGTLKKHLYHVSYSVSINQSNDDKPLSPSLGDNIYHGEKKCGEIVNLVKIPANQWHFLILCNDQAINSNQIGLNENSQTFLQVHSLPYAIT